MMIAQAIFGLALLLCLTHAQEQVVFNTLSGPVRGKRTTVNGKSIDVLLSIPFAKPPTGSLRFEPPQPMDPWTETLDAIEASAACVQPHGYYLSEDCLYLNIWKPSSTTRESKLPVMLYIYGGSFQTGRKDDVIYSGQFYTANNNVIFATVNYRLGLLGFGFLGSDTLPGNLGLLDQLEAMKWIQNNIEYFGGDPHKITIFGEDAGSWSVGLHLISPKSTSYFDKAILQSGSPLNKILSSVVYPHEISRQHVKNLTEAIDCPTYTDLDIYTCLMNASTNTLQKGIDAVSGKGIDFYPVVDGYFLPEAPLDLMKQGLYKKVNLLMGVTKHEYSSAISSIMKPDDTTLRKTGEKVSYDTMDSIFGSLPLTNRWDDKQKVDALKVFYGSSVSHPEDKVVEVLRDICSDLVFVCPVHLHASMASKNNDVFFYVFNYKVSTAKVPNWVGVTHGLDLQPTFGFPLKLSRHYTDNDRKMSRIIMTYWTNFAKTGNPNSPVTVTTNWPTFNYTDQFYMEFDPDASCVTRQGPRRHECAFINEILPNVPMHDEAKSCEWPQRATSKGYRVRLDITGVIAAAATVMMLYH